MSESAINSRFAIALLVVFVWWNYYAFLRVENTYNVLTMSNL